MLVTNEQATPTPAKAPKEVPVAIKYSPNVEMAASLHHLLTSSNLSQEPWAQVAMGKMTDADKEEAQALGAATGNWSLVMDLVCYLELINLTDAASFFSDLAETDDVDVAYGLLSGMIDKRELKKLLASEDARARWSDDRVERVFSRNFVLSTLEGCGDLKRRLSAFMIRYWNAVFADVWEDMGVALMEKSDDERAALASVGARGYLSSCHPSLSVDDAGVHVAGDPVRNYPYSSLKAIDVYPTAFLTSELMLTRVDRRLTIYKPVSLARDMTAVTPAQVFKFLKAISSETKMRILRELREGPKTTKELSEALDMAPSTISVHLKMMRDAELVYPQRVQNAVYNRFLVENYKAFLRYLEDYLG